ncbi:MoaD/ThiS family protein [Singulisphaera sp. PoT]|uniref:MoaD/ThiS family protein n=1 Tax=Singulisphaera sp. PoT TaxID=3411797 RepID=UPI003BF5C405
MNVKLFALAKQLAGRDEIRVELQEGATIADLRSSLAADYPALAGLVPNMMMAVDARYATDDQPLDERAEIAAIPPVSGG